MTIKLKCHFIVNVLFSGKSENILKIDLVGVYDWSLYRELCARTQNRFDNISAYIVFSEKKSK